MRTIKFRAKSLKYGGWVYGYVEMFNQAMSAPTASIHEFSDWNLNTSHEVDPKTIGEFTGLLDKNGKEIYEGDVLASEPWMKGDAVEVVKFRDGAFFAESGADACLFYNKGYFAKESKILGNIDDNPELINEN